MMMDCITIAGFILAIFVAGVTAGKLVEKIERYIMYIAVGYTQ